jgi:hypothetical protein
MQTGQMWVLGSAPYSLAQLQKALVLVSSWTWVSMPMTASNSTSALVAAAGASATADALVEPPRPLLQLCCALLVGWCAVKALCAGMGAACWRRDEMAAHCVCWGWQLVAAQSSLLALCVVCVSSLLHRIAMGVASVRRASMG